MIIGVTGTNGSGKGTVVSYLIAKGFKHYSARDYILDEINRQGLTPSRTTMRDIGNNLRKLYGASHIIETLYGRAKREGGDGVIESVREVAGANFLHAQGAVIIAVDADRKVRYRRAVLRDSSTDQVTFEQFCTQEDREMSAPETWNMNVFGVMRLADYTIRNEGTIEELHATIDSVISSIGGRDAH